MQEMERREGEEEEFVFVCVGGWVLSWVNLISPDSHVATTSYPTSESKQTQPQQAVVTPAAHRGAQDSICFPQCEPKTLQSQQAPS